jgi:Ca-activated chloride channel family protein
MTFLWPPMLALLALVPLGVLLSRAIEERRRRRLVAVSGLGRAPAVARSGRRLRDRLPPLLFLAAFTLLAIALARPQATLSIPRAEGTVVLLFDVSGSMAADDVEPTRMEAAKAAARAFVEGRPAGVVIGVVAFSDAGVAVQPPTSERANVLAAIERLGPSRGTSLGQGIAASLEAITRSRLETPPETYSNRSPAPSTPPAPVPPGSDASTVIVLLSDGENNERPDPLLAAQAAADRGIRIVTVGIGTAGGTVLELDGFRVHTALDEGALRQIAAMTEGTYTAAADAAGLRAAYDQLDLQIVARPEAMEVTALLAGIGAVLLAVGGIASLARWGRLP